MSYEAYFGLKELPFSITPDPRYFYESKQHMGALIRIQHNIDSAKGLTVVIGDMGLGKTFLSRKLFEKMQNEENKYEPGLLVVIHHEISAAWLIKKMAVMLGVEYPAEDKSTLISQICKQLVEIDESGRKAVIMIDEAHMLQTREIYEELRGLLNVEGGSHKLLNIVLFGPPDLEDCLALDPPLVSRIGLKFTLEPLDAATTEGYVDHRTKTSGAPEKIFSTEACKTLYEYTKGIPRLINAACDNALLEGFLQQKKIIDPEIIHTIASGIGISRKDVSDVKAEQKAKTEQPANEQKNEDGQDKQKKREPGSWYYT